MTVPLNCPPIEAIVGWGDTTERPLRPVAQAGPTMSSCRSRLASGGSLLPRGAIVGGDCRDYASGDRWLAGVTPMASIRETAQEFFVACEAGKGWSGCK